MTTTKESLAKEHEKINNRVTIALDGSTYNLMKELKNNSTHSQSEIFRKALKFYYKYKKIINNKPEVTKKVDTYLELLSNGEHIILDIDHYLAFLKFIENSPNKEEFYANNKSIGKSHAEEFANRFEVNTIERVVERLETCNFFKIVKNSTSRYTLLLGSDIQKNFIKMFLEEVLNGMGFSVEIREGFSKLKIILNNISY